MKFIISTGALLKHISSIQSIVPSSPMLPILENLLFQIQAGTLSITASDLQTSIITNLSVESEENGSIAIPAKMLAETLRNLPEQPVTFKVDFSTYSVEIHSENGRYKLSGENAMDFPKTNNLGKTEDIDISSVALSQAISYTLFATSNDEMRPAMNGVLINLKDSQTEFVSSDTHRLICYSRTDITNKRDSKFIVHKKALALLKNILPAEETPVRLAFNDTNAVFTFENYQLICRLIDEHFPDYQNVIPVDNNNLLAIDRMKLVKCLKRIIIYANRSTYQVRFKINGNSLQVSAEDLDFSNEAKETLDCEHNGESLEIGFNARLLIEILNNLHTEKVTFRLSESSSAALIIPEGKKEEEDIIMLLMPIMLHSYA